MKTRPALTAIALALGLAAPSAIAWDEGTAPAIATAATIPAAPVALARITKVPT